MRTKARAIICLAIGLVAGSLVMAGCCGPKGTYPQPGFAGVPQAIHRSADFALPLSAGSRTELAQFMASNGNRAELEDNPPRPGQIRQIGAAYGPILDQLQRQSPTRADLGEGSSFASLFDAKIHPLVVHDARLGWESPDGHEYSYYDPGTDGIRALVKGNFVFAFYARRVLPATNAPSAAHPNAWDLAPKAPGPTTAYTGLVVFSRNFALPTIAR